MGKRPTSAATSGLTNSEKSRTSGSRRLPTSSSLDARWMDSIGSGAVRPNHRFILPPALHRRANDRASPRPVGSTAGSQGITADSMLGGVVSRSPQTAAPEPQRAIWKEGISQEGMEGQAPAKKGPAPGPETPPHAPPRGAIRAGPRWRQKGRGVEAGDVSPSKARDGGVIGSLAHVTGPTPPVMGIGSGSAHNATRGGRLASLAPVDG